MMIKNDYSALVIVFIILIVVICGFGYMLAGGAVPFDEGAQEPTSTAETAAAQNDRDQEYLQTAIAIGIRETQVAEKEAALLAAATEPTRQPPAEEEAVEEKDPAATIRASLVPMMYGILIIAGIVITIIAAAVIDHVHNSVYLRQQEVQTTRITEQRRLAELRAAEIKARRVREGAVRAPSAAIDVPTSKSNGNGRAPRKLPLAG